MNIDDFSTFVFDLTNSAIGLNLDDHQASQIQILQKAISFDAAWWGWSNFSGGRNRLINTGLFNLPQSYDSVIRAVLHLDPFVKSGRNLAIFAKTIDIKTLELPEDYAKALQAFQISSVLSGHCRLQGETEFNFFLSLYRRKHGPAFSDADCRTYRLVLRHIEQNLSLNLKAELRSLAPDQGEAAIVSEGGAVVRATREFQNKLQAETANIKKLLSKLSFGQDSWIGDNLILESSKYKPGLALVRMAPNTMLARLSPKERQVADALKKGMTMRDIAAERGVSINTVRNQVAAIYKKTDTKNRTIFIAKFGLR